MSTRVVCNESTILNAVSDNETNLTTPILTPASEECVQIRCDKEISEESFKESKDEINRESQNESTQNISNDVISDSNSEEKSSKTIKYIFNLLKNTDDKRPADGNAEAITNPAPRGPALKREKSHTDSIERKKKRVKFSILSDEIIPNSPAEYIKDIQIINEIQFQGNNLSTKLKKLLSRTNKKASSPDTEPLPPNFNTTEESSSNYSCEHFESVPTHDKDHKNKESESCEATNRLSTDLSISLEELDFIDSNTSFTEDTVDGYCIKEQRLTETNASNNESNSSNLKREGTFTLDESSPAKVVKPNNHQNMCDSDQTPITEDIDVSSSNKDNESPVGELYECEAANNKKSVAFKILPEIEPNNTVQLRTPEKRSSILKRPRPRSIENEFNFLDVSQEKEETPPSSLSNSVSACSETIEKCPSKSSVSNIGNSAKRTLTTAWRNAITRQDSMELKRGQSPVSSNTNIKGKSPNKSQNNSTKENLVTKKESLKESKSNRNSEIKSFSWSWKSENNIRLKKKSESPAKTPSEQENKKVQQEKEKGATVEESQEPNQDKTKRPKTKNPSIVSRASSWSGVNLSVPHVRRDNTFMKVDAKKYDSEKERLQNEVAKLNVEKDRLMGEVSDLRTKHEEENAARKAQKRAFEMKLRQQKEEDGRKHELHVCDLKNRMEEDKREALCQLKECLTRTYETELLRNNRGRDEETRRLLGEARLTVERLQTSLRRETLKGENHSPSCQHHSTEREIEKLTRELTVIKDQKKKMEETILRQQQTERDRVSELRKIHEQHETQLGKLLKSNKQEATRLLEEIKSKDRVITSMEKRLNQQDIKLRQHDEKQRDVNKDEGGRRISSRNSVSSCRSSTKSGLQREDSQSSVNKDGNQSDKDAASTPLTASISTQSDDIAFAESAEPEPEEPKMAEAYAEINRLKKIVDEQQQHISNLIQQSIEKENPDHCQLQVWPQKRESCMKASELPTVMEQVENDYQETLKVPQVQPFRRCISLITPSNNLRGNNSLPSFDLAKSEKIKELESTNATLEAELQEAKDHAELLEFRILEFTEGVNKGCDKAVNTVNQGTSTTLEDCSNSSVDNSHPLPLFQDDLSLPLSIDSGLDLGNDTKARISEGKSWLNQLSKLATQSSEKTAAASLAALLEWLGNLPSLPLSPIQNGTPTPMSPTSKSLSRMGADEHMMLTGGDLTVLAARLQETLTDPGAQENALVDTIAKLRMLDSSLGSLQARVNTLNEENRELQDALAALSEAHETRTEASGTESEIVHRKTPSIHSDLSDVESDSDHQHSNRHKILANATSFQESGIFDTSCDFVNVSTQTKNEELSLTDSNDDAASDTSDVDLKSAVARLASIRSAVRERDLKSMRIQDLQESDEYLKSDLEGDRVSISKLEYDSIVAAERQLQNRLEILKADRDDLALQCQTLKEQSNQQKSRPESEEVLRGEYNVLTQRLEVSERCRRDLFEEKCELEEAENDARLMVQRLESQLDAAREMESLLSASLSQEQQLSREMQRKFREFQVHDKERRMREEILEKEGRECLERLAEVTKSRDSLSAKLSFAAYNLMLAKLWKDVDSAQIAKALNTSNAALSVIPFTTSCDTTVLNFNSILDYPKDEPAVVKIFDNVNDAGVQTHHNALVDKQIQVETIVELMEDSQSTISTRALSDEEDESAPAKKKLKSTATKSTSTMTHLDELLSEREKFYLEQIETLQKEKMNLRKDQDTERSDSLQHYTELEIELKELKEKLIESEKDKCNLIFKLEELEDSRDLARKDMQKRVEELKGDMNRNYNLYDMEKAALQRGYETRLQEAIEDRTRQESKVKELEHKLMTLRHELEVVGGAIASDLVELDTGDSDDGQSNGSKYSKNNSYVFKSGNDNELLDKIRELVKSESSLRQKIGELEKKESAYRETIEEADTIMSSHVTSYTHRIEELEAVIDQHVAKIKQLETSEERLRGALKSNSRTSEGDRITELLDRVIEIENSELKLKERVWSLERIEKELQIKLAEGEKTNQSLRVELRDQEELVQKLMTLQSENNLLSVELQQAHDSVRKLGDVQQSEIYFRSRVEELEATENSLRDALRQADILMVQKERRLKEQMRLLEEELHSSRTLHENSSVKALEARETEMSLRKHLEELRSRLQESEKELRDSSSESINHETQHRTEVTKLRNQLKLANAQLTELDGLNCALRDQVASSDVDKENISAQLEERIRRHEQDVLSLNLQISNRDSKVEDLEGQLQQLRHASAAGELDALSSTPLAGIHAAMTQLTNSIQGCEICSKAQSDNLNDITNQLGTLTDLLDGNKVTSEDSSDNTQSDLDSSSEVDGLTTHSL